MLTPVEEAQLRDLIAQQSALLSLAGVEATILSKLGATKVTLSDLPSASVIDDADLLLLRQGVTDKSVTGLTFKNLIPTTPDASETVKGVGELATNAEAQAYTANKLIDGAKLAAALQGSNQSLAASGYQKIPGGLIIQWGSLPSTADDGTASITWPISFPNNCYMAVASADTFNISYQLWALTAKTTTTGTFRQMAIGSASGGYYISIGN